MSNNTLKREKLKKMGIITFINCAIFMFSYGLMYRTSFNGDTLAVFKYPFGQANEFLGSGRYIFALFCEIMFRCGVNMAKAGGIYVLVSLVLLPFVPTLMTMGYFTACNDGKFSTETSLGKILKVDFVILLGFINLIFLESLYFSAYAVMPGLACLFLALSLYAFAKKKYIRTIIWLSCMLMVYQAYVGIFISFALLFVFVEYKGKLSKESFWKSFFVILGSGCLYLIDIFSVTLLRKMGIIKEVVKSFQLVSPIEIITRIIEAQIDILKNEYGLAMIRFIPFLILAIAGLCILVVYIKEKKKISDWLYLVLLVAASNLSVFAVVFGGYLYLPPRVVVSYWGFISAIVLLGVHVVKAEKVKTFLFVVTCIVLILQSVNANIIISELYISNTLDLEYVKDVQYNIDKYEKATGIEIENVSICTDEKCNQYWMDNIDYYNYNINERCVSVEWQCRILLEKCSGREYNKINMPEDIYNKHFDGKDWDRFDEEEQLVFEGDTLYFAVY